MASDVDTGETCVMCGGSLQVWIKEGEKESLRVEERERDCAKSVVYEIVLAIQCVDNGPPVCERERRGRRL